MHGCSEAHTPIRVDGIYSHVLYRPWLCRYSDLEESCPGFMKHQDIDRRQASSLSAESFVREYEAQNKPVIINGLVSHWPALRKWSPAYLSRACGSRLFRATSATAPR